MTTSRAGLLPTTEDALAAALRLLRQADHGALATLDPQSGAPATSRVGLAILPDGRPVLPASALSPHYAALLADARCSLLVGAPGKGDPLAAARLTLSGRGRLLGGDEASVARSAYLGAHPRGGLYVDLPDFRFFRLDIEQARFIAGFGRAYQLDPAALLGQG